MGGCTLCVTGLSDHPTFLSYIQNLLQILSSVVRDPPGKCLPQIMDQRSTTALLNFQELQSFIIWSGLKLPLILKLIKWNTLFCEIVYF